MIEDVGVNRSMDAIFQPSTAKIKCVFFYTLPIINSRDSDEKVNPSNNFTTTKYTIDRYSEL